MHRCWIDRLIAAFRQSIEVSSSDDDANSDLPVEPMDYALRELQIQSDSFNALDNKASGLIQFCAVVIGLSTIQTAGLPTNKLRLAALILFAVALGLCLYAWYMRTLPGLPTLSHIEKRTQHLGVEGTRKELLANIKSAVAELQRLGYIKYDCLCGSYIAIMLGIGTLVFSLIWPDVWK